MDEAEGEHEEGNTDLSQLVLGLFILCPFQIDLCGFRFQTASAGVCRFPFSNLKQTLERCPRNHSFDCGIAAQLMGFSMKWRLE